MPALPFLALSNTQTTRLAMSTNYSSAAIFPTAIQGRVNFYFILLLYLHHPTEHLYMVNRMLVCLSFCALTDVSRLGCDLSEWQAVKKAYVGASFLKLCIQSM